MKLIKSLFLIIMACSTPSLSGCALDGEYLESDPIILYRPYYGYGYYNSGIWISYPYDHFCGYHVYYGNGWHYYPHYYPEHRGTYRVEPPGPGGGRNFGGRGGFRGGGFHGGGRGRR
jgi:uncharacterized membrane protein YgcG